MNDLSTLANIAEILGVIIVVGGLYFGLLQMHQFRQQRRELAAIELFRFFGNPQFTQAYQMVLNLPDGLTAEEIRTRHADLEDAAMLISCTMENIGVMTFQRIVPFVIVHHLIGSSVVFLWRKLEIWVIALRKELDDDAEFEWFEWLSDRLEEYDVDHYRGPAFQAYKDWSPAHLGRRK